MLLIQYWHVVSTPWICSGWWSERVSMIYSISTIPHSTLCIINTTPLAALNACALLSTAVKETLPLHSSRLSSSLPTTQCLLCPLSHTSSLSAHSPLSYLPWLSFDHCLLVCFQFLELRIAMPSLFYSMTWPLWCSRNTRSVHLYSSTPSMFHLYLKHTMHFPSGDNARH